MKTKLALVAALISMQFGCVSGPPQGDVGQSVTVTPQTVKTMSSEFLCEMLGPGWIGTEGEHEDIREELRTRNLACDYGQLRTMDEPRVAESASDLVRYECYTYVGSKHVLTLPVAPLNSDVGMVNVTFHGDQVEAVYQQSGLTQLWLFEESLYIKLDPDLTAGYYDFRSAEEGEKRAAEAVFECKKRR